jgi:multiple sugar transport system ATP-binding protein
VARVTLDRVSKRFGSTIAVEDLTLAVEDKEFLVLLGPSGCGKTTVLRLIAGLAEPDTGTIVIGDRVVNGMPSKERDIAMVFQNYALYPHMSVFDNIAFGLRMRGYSHDERRRMVEEAASSLGLQELLKRKPAELSGGQRQRVALGRTIVRRPAVFLMDEPLSNLDAKLRVQTRLELVKLHERLEGTFIYVTHDQVEAMTMGSRIAIMHEGRLHQLGRPQDVYRRPANLFVAAFIGSPAMNLFEVGLRSEAGGLVAKDESLEFRLTAEQQAVLRDYATKSVVVGVRPEHLELEPEEGAGGVVRAIVYAVESLGHESHVTFRSGEREVVARLAPELAIKPGDAVTLHVSSPRLHFFDPTTGLRLPEGEARAAEPMPAARTG